LHRAIVRLGFFVALALLGGVAEAAAQELGQPADLYTARTIVTGTDMRMRPTGFKICLEDVLVKTSGDQSLLQDPRVAALGPTAGELVVHHDYIDRMGNLPIHDDQGTKDRPYYLTCVLDQARIDALLSTLGHKLWVDRPPLALVLAVHGFGKSGMLTADGDFWPDMRISLADAAARYGVTVSLPSGQALAANQITADNLAKAPVESVLKVAQRSGGALALYGTLDRSDPDHGWIAHWSLKDAEGRRQQWQAKGVNFDQAFRVAVLGAAQILSGNGKP
jgi:hypothetical protein